MGWSSGSRLMSVVIETIKENCDREGQREQIYKDLIIAFEDMDCDTLYECMGTDISFDIAMKTLYPADFDENLC